LKIKSDDIRFNIAISKNALKIQFTQAVAAFVWLIRILSFFFTHMVTRFTKPKKNITYYNILQYGICIQSRTNCVALQNTTYKHIIRGEIRRRNCIKIKRSDDLRVVRNTQLPMNYYYQNVKLLS